MCDGSAVEAPWDQGKMLARFFRRSGESSTRHLKWEGEEETRTDRLRYQRKPGGRWAWVLGEEGEPEGKWGGGC